MDPFPEYRQSSKGPFKDNVSRIHPKIVVGSGYQLDLHTISVNNVTHVLNCATDDAAPTEFKEYYESMDKYTCINAIDSEDVDITDWYPNFKETMNRYLQDPECKTVYVHCRLGKNRSGFLAVLYVCDRFHFTYEKACKALLVQRPCALDNHVFHKQVQEYLKKNA